MGKAADEAKGSGTGFFGGMLQAASGFLAANVIGSISSQIGGFVSDAFSDARETQQLMAATNQIITNTGGAAGMSASQVADLASSLSDAAGQSLFGDDQIQGAENVLLKYKELKGIIPGVTHLAVDMAQNLGKEPAAAAEFLGRALQKPFDATAKLAKEGIVLSDAQQAMLAKFKATNDVAGAQQYLMQQLNGTFGGSAKAAADATGGWAEFQGRLGEAGETMATAVLPVLGKLGSIVLDLVMPAIEGLANFFAKELPPAIDFVTGALDTVSHMFASTGESSDELSGVLAFLGETWKQLQEIIDLATELIQATVVPIFKSIAAFLLEHKTEITAILTAAWTIIKVTIDTVLTVIKGLIKVALQLIHGDWEGAWQTIQDTLAHVWDNIKIIVMSALAILKTELSMAWDAIKGTLASAWDNIKAMFADWAAQAVDLGEGLINSVIGGIKSAASNLADMVSNAVGDAVSAGKKALHDAGVPGFAGGVENFGGGLALVGERGPELIALPRGSSVYPAGQTRQMLAGGAGGGMVLNFTIDARGSQMSEKQFEATIRRVLDESGTRAFSRMRTGG